MAKKRSKVAFAHNLGKALEALPQKQHEEWRRLHPNGGYDGEMGFRLTEAEAEYLRKLSYTGISHYRGSPTLKKLCDFLGITVDSLWDESDEDVTRRIQRETEENQRRERRKRLKESPKQIVQDLFESGEGEDGLEDFICSLRREFEIRWEKRDKPWLKSKLVQDHAGNLSILWSAVGDVLRAHGVKRSLEVRDRITTIAVELHDENPIRMDSYERDVVPVCQEIARRILGVAKLPVTQPEPIPVPTPVVEPHELQERRFIFLDCPNEGIEYKCRCTVNEYNLLRQGSELWCKKCGLHLTKDSPIEEEGHPTPLPQNRPPTETVTVIEPVPPPPAPPPQTQVSVSVMSFGGEEDEEAVLDRIERAKQLQNLHQKQEDDDNFFRDREEEKQVFRRGDYDGGLTRTREP